ncbi:acyl-CoA reductase [Mucilaginibacter sp. L3T2-6]|uniref:acyl-CoA reductase n=1 Tax=Mucilaginibacter sp. L3T2-6 TaxID=3062491 RepID=UPI0026749A95|nr:acyl-CoA reductase [Mucilaginibacter sp. L3T2-6]MDO3643325.1 acyl-CoA reductase [Mucilaginibacter sp. L3T2-6]MDV6215742.1 acyl-CoA reductase [Mucilaginibacter sp. L3T2-6]
MSKIDKSRLIEIFSQLGTSLSQPDEALSELINTEHIYNPWFTPKNVLQAVKAIGAMLNEADLSKWLNRYDIHNNRPAKIVGLILAGNIPLVGFHDVLCVLVTGNFAMIKTSSQDARLIKHILHLMTNIEPAMADQYSFVERLENFDAVIATGSNNTSRYFDYYFGKVPNIIRKNRNSIAVLTGEETADQLYNLGHDIFDYFGLGCRNVSKLLVPNGYQFDYFFKSIEQFEPTINHNKYNNNYGYNKSIYLVGGEQHLDNGFLLLKENPSLSSPLAVIFYEYYDDLQSAEEALKEQTESIQCVVSGAPLRINNQVVSFGNAQRPALWDYADNVDTMAFLTKIKE